MLPHLQSNNGGVDSGGSSPPTATASSHSSNQPDCDWRDHTTYQRESRRWNLNMSAARYMLLEFLLEDEMIFTAALQAIWEQIELDMQPAVPRHRMRTSCHTGHVWINDILSGHEQQCYDMFRLHPNMFMRLKEMLVSRNLILNSRRVTANEQLAMFLYVTGHGVPTRAMCERFQHSSQTISYYVNKVTFALASLKEEYILLPSPSQVNECHAHIAGSKLFYPYFKDALGAIDGSHIPANVPSVKHNQFRNYRGRITQNVMAVVSFDMMFQYVCVGWEGSAADTEVLKWALLKGGFTVPCGKYYLVDKGYENTTAFLAPYPAHQYLLSSFCGQSSGPYANKQEKFNHRHAQLRKVVDRAFSVLKTRFQALSEGNRYPWATQRKMVFACCVVQNFIRREQGYDEYFNRVGEGNIDGTDNEDAQLGIGTTSAAGDVLREQISDQIWAAEDR